MWIKFKQIKYQLNANNLLADNLRIDCSYTNIHRPKCKRERKKTKWRQHDRAHKYQKKMFVVMQIIIYICNKFRSMFVCNCLCDGVACFEMHFIQLIFVFSFASVGNTQWKYTHTHMRDHINLFLSKIHEPHKYCHDLIRINVERVRCVSLFACFLIRGSSITKTIKHLVIKYRKQWHEEKEDIVFILMILRV